MAIQNNSNAMNLFPAHARASVMDRLSSVDLCAFNSSEYAV